VFALLPSAKTLVITSALLGISLGIHDFYYIYALYLICSGRIRTNLRKCAEYTFYFGIGIIIPIAMTAFMVNNVRIVMLIVTVLVALVAFIYPASAYSSMVDDYDPTLKPEPRRRPAKNNPPMPNPYAQAPVQPAPAYTPQSAFGEPEPQYQAPAPEPQYQPQQDPYQQPYQQQYAPEQPQYQPQQYAPVQQPAYQQPQQYAPVQQPVYQQPQQYAPVQQPAYQQPQQYAPVQQPAYQQPYQPQNVPDMYGQNPYPQQPADPMAFLNDDDPGNGGV
jgi:hypothetical protein